MGIGLDKHGARWAERDRGGLDRVQCVNSYIPQLIISMKRDVEIYTLYPIQGYCPVGHQILQIGLGTECHLLGQSR